MHASQPTSATDAVLTVLTTEIWPILAFLTPELASRIQFGWTITIHIIFAALSVGLAPFLVYFTVQEVRTGKQRYARLRKFWTKIFAVGFIMGTVTGIPMGFMFGTNFAAFSQTAGELIGGPLSFEAKMAFMMEAVFLGVLLFGRERVSDWFYALSSFMVALGAWLSAFWILVVNSWMQTPRGYEVVMEDGLPIAQLTDPMAAFFNPRFPWMYVHMQNAAVISVTLLIAGIAAYFVWKNRDSEVWKTALRVTVVVLLLTSAFQAIHGDMYGRHVAETQPHKFAAMEAHYETGQADLHLIAIPTELESITDPRADNLYTISIPHLASFLAEGDPTAEITGLNDFEYESPPVAWVFWSFRVMVGLGFWFIALGAWGTYRLWRGGLADDDRLLKALMVSSPLGFIALITGWYVAEIGRQPWIIQDVLTTAEGVSPPLSGTEATLTLIAFVIGYVLLFSVFLYVLKRIVDEEASRHEVGIEEDNRPDSPGVTADD
ncbi:cytochrome bd ubiquinol oxidase subunit I [Natrialba magadii ATCC 43099]|uniref:Cytochrome bd ubiquinol oxidase subunit I n=1 Tax=Natrialba magadii (strain ATCC 43099 / DSM 3394 / CCM 3739 / CIP 104546 / IAM 13178 / JCM 8861 / NBRC 102185 / NCIMB 2190 / MS3) TaxID=547559 RepID=D3SRB6_NATMM|nr:cytochrome ubiquinol oxidase subunit I [Natrialba magadii]ADD04621.1 cytochrome bd ubiquinol oxidase subunit I [Natrialba magadii ATCC 43099]ELY25277.1 cytochrome bd ubiquinol oxidase subunit I [Natrialba magadii ATCC 43099]